jgi:transcription initiation factor TFIIE subunit beta
MRLQDLAIMTNTPMDTDAVLLEKFRAHDRVEYNPKTDLYSYKVNNTTSFMPAKAF